MMNKQKGFVLITLLIIGQFIALLASYSLNAINLGFKLNYYHLQREINLRLAQNALKAAETSLLENGPSCLIKTASAYRFVTRPLSWWHTVGCSQNTDQTESHIVIEFMGNDPCATIKTDGNQLLTANYYRITLLWRNIQRRLARVVLQSTVALPTESIENGKCENTRHYVAIGRQSIRELQSS